MSANGRLTSSELSSISGGKLKRFQKDHKLPADGVAGAKTWAALK